MQVAQASSAVSKLLVLVTGNPAIYQLISVLYLFLLLLYYYSHVKHCWVFLQICINLNTKWWASNTFEATVAGLDHIKQVNMEISIPNTTFFCVDLTSHKRL